MPPTKKPKPVPMPGARRVTAPPKGQVRAPAPLDPADPRAFWNRPWIGMTEEQMAEQIEGERRLGDAEFFLIATTVRLAQRLMGRFRDGHDLGCTCSHCSDCGFDPFWEFVGSEWAMDNAATRLECVIAGVSELPGSLTVTQVLVRLGDLEAAIADANRGDFARLTKWRATAKWEWTESVRPEIEARVAAMRAEDAAKAVANG